MIIILYIYHVTTIRGIILEKSISSPPVTITSYFILFPSIDWGNHFKLSAAQVTIYYFYLCPTCQGYSFTSVSCPPTILVRMLAWPQVQVLVLVLGMLVAGVSVVVDTGESVVVEAKIIINNQRYICPTHDSPVTSVVTETSPVITAKNPVLVV